MRAFRIRRLQPNTALPRLLFQHGHHVPVRLVHHARIFGRDGQQRDGPAKEPHNAPRGP